MSTDFQIYLVGGAVRDALLQSHKGQQKTYDKDWVVVGASPQAMVHAGFKPVGQDFPVFLHPQTQEEYALARTERKTAQGYHGFAFYAAPEVTLEQDLARRDLTINAMALPQAQVAHLHLGNAWQQHLIDPYAGQVDLAAKCLRHVGAAFAEDPVRILRVARFAARYPDFAVASETLALMRDMAAAGEVQHLVAERVWKEISRGLMEDKPSRMFETLRECGALAIVFPELNRLWGVPQRADYHPEVDTGVHAMMVLDMAAQLHAPLAVRWACLMHDLGKGTTPADILPRHLGHEERSARVAAAVAHRWRVNADYKALADVVAREHGNIHRSTGLSPEAAVRLLERLDAFRRPERLHHILQACECDARGRLGLDQQPYVQAQALLTKAQAAQGVNTAHIAADCRNKWPDDKKLGLRIAQAIQSERVKAVAAVAA